MQSGIYYKHSELKDGTLNRQLWVEKTHGITKIDELFRVVPGNALNICSLALHKNFELVHYQFQSLSDVP